MPRYIVVPPVSGPEGDRYWTIADTQFPDDPNFAVVLMFGTVPEAEARIRQICRELNGY